MTQGQSPIAGALALETLRVPKALPRPARFLARLLGRPLALLALIWIAIVVVGGLFAGQISSYDPLDQDLLAIKQLPSAEHLLGTDALGRDVLSRLLHGTTPSLVGVVQALAVVSLIGVLLGLSAGYFGGWWDRLVVQYVSLLQAIPVIVVLLSVLSIFGQSMSAAMVTLGILGSAGVSRVVRSVVLGVREELYIAAARISGLGDARIILTHILPRIFGPVVVQLALFACITVVIQTGINFLGLGVPPPAPSWGGMVFEASASINDFPWLLLPTGSVLALTILSFGLLGDSLRDTAVETWAAAAHRHTLQVRVPEPITDAPAHTILALRDLTIVSGQGESARTLVDHVNLDLANAETLGIVGESGSGKTLTVMSMLGLLPAGTRMTSGRMSLDGTTIDLGNQRQLEALRGGTIGMIFQEPMAALDPCFTVGHHLAEVIRVHKGGSRADIEKQIIALLHQVKITNPEEVARRYPHQISGGMAQRVGIARALAAEPRILLADEPTTALDVTVQAEILELLRALSASRNMAVIIVTHDWGVVADLCDRAMVLYQGRALETASVVDLFERPSHPYTAALLKANPHGAKPGEPLPTIEETLRSIQEGVG
ncbi:MULTISPECIES: dipeptide/oligopeptide/nickel ABC transporter permease/ATP-binding protein [unclassified Bradyrhizobium]|uniref:dipeptide/oligopeptide/nickel ABC transporter permease/ATP-binding protein n=1 Tax=unclassified Bradyrhizobium TaxID=2631580 RepID=UPI001BAC622D|nr:MULTISPECIES: dipeptide/oligopeptide/nickel ABC transporter permease/ATP-binding protein [unclassified Bradyrhizobium]MBR1227110.1 dipeptide/oligopeptide/nickel ABC transporter permease/ATP-binding protein [Bradyrhizobium sp. AUGA SZCCT0176]